MKLPPSDVIGSDSRCCSFSLITAVVIGPLFEGNWYGDLLQLLFVTFVFASAVYANWRRHVRVTVVITAGVVGWGLHTASFLFPDDWVAIAKFSTGFVFLGLTAFLLLRSIFVDLLAKPDALLASGCVYLLLGFMWALGYSALTYIENDSFDIPIVLDTGEHPSLSIFLYFSFVTMSTLGYGDILPVSDLARTLAWMQSVTGQFYLAVLVAYLVNMLPSQGEGHVLEPNR